MSVSILKKSAEIARNHQEMNHIHDIYTSLEGIKDEEVKSLAPTRCQISTKATWSYVVAVSSLRSFSLVSQRDF